jgi:hypothetical protein
MVYVAARAAGLSERMLPSSQVPLSPVGPWSPEYTVGRAGTNTGSTIDDITPSRKQASASIPGIKHARSSNPTRTCCRRSTANAVRVKSLARSGLCSAAKNGAITLRSSGSKRNRFSASGPSRSSTLPG